MIKAIGLVEFTSIAKGIEAADAMLKTAQIDILDAKAICPGKYIVLISGDVSAVENSVKAGMAIGGSQVVDDFVIPNVHPAVITAIAFASEVDDLAALGVIESFAVASLIVAADAAVKAAEVSLIEIRVGMGIGGKSFVTLTGDVGAVKAAMAAGTESVVANGMLVETAIIPRPHKNLKRYIL